MFLFYVRSTNLHSDPARNALNHVPFDDYEWPAETVRVYVDDPRLSHAYGHSQRDIKRYARIIDRGSPPPAIVLGDHGNRYAVHDGAHRLDAARVAELAVIYAYIGKPRSLPISVDNSYRPHRITLRVKNKAIGVAAMN